MKCFCRQGERRSEKRRSEKLKSRRLVAAGALGIAGVTEKAEAPGIAIAARIFRTVGMVFLLLFLLSMLIGCNDRTKQMLQRLMATQPEQYQGEGVTEEKLEELKREIKKFEDEITELVKKQSELGIYYRMLGMEYFDQEMYGPALELFREGMEIYPNNRLLHYYAGVSQSQLAKAEAEEEKREKLFEQAAYYYERAIELKENYVDALYALSVLYVFELDRPSDALPHVRKILQLRDEHYRAEFLLARIRVEEGRVEEAMELYQNIAENAPQQDMVERARENRERLMRREY